MREINELEELKKIELSIMKKIHTFCESNGIEYFLCFGTLLGAVRHKGFIPWDDDIDIFMKRAEYDRFLQSFEKDQTDLELEIVNYTTKRYYGRVFSKVIDVNTVLKEPQYKTDDDIGVFVDIWPLDGVPENPLYRRLYLFFAQCIKKLLLASSMYCDKNQIFIKKIAITIASCFNPKKVVKYLDQIARKYDIEDSDFCTCYSDLASVYPSRLFQERIMVRFEDAEFWAPRDFDAVLREDYGDYMQLPPENERKPHHIMNTFYKDLVPKE